MQERANGLRRIRLPRTPLNRDRFRWLSDDVSAVPLLEQLLPLPKQETNGHPQSLPKEKRVGLARHVGGALALDLADEPYGNA